MYIDQRSSPSRQSPPNNIVDFPEACHFSYYLLFVDSADVVLSIQLNKCKALKVYTCIGKDQNIVGDIIEKVLLFTYAGYYQRSVEK